METEPLRLLVPTIAGGAWRRCLRQSFYTVGKHPEIWFFALCGSETTQIDPEWPFSVRRGLVIDNYDPGTEEIVGGDTRFKEK